MSAICIQNGAEMPEPSSVTTVVIGADLGKGLTVAIRDDAEALNGSYVSQVGEYQPIAEVDVPVEGESFNVWVRYRNASLQMKAYVDGSWQEYEWNWSKQAKGFAWRKVGTFSRSDLGTRIRFITPPSTSSLGGMDGIVITANLEWEPATPNRAQFDAPDAANATVALEVTEQPKAKVPGESAVTLKWEESMGAIPPYLYSMNTPAMFSADKVSGPEWPALIEYLQPRLLRLHSTGQIKGTWMRKGGDQWDYENVRASLLAAKLPAQTELLINIYRWPDSYDLDEDGRLDVGRIENFATLCADLVRFVNFELDLGVVYWEVTNERDFAYWRAVKNGNQPDPVALAVLYNRAAEAMRAVDPSIKVGGPATCSPTPIEPLLEFARHAKDNLDFISFHSYASGDTSESDEMIYDKTSIIAEDSALLISGLNEVMGDKEFGVHLNEYNISYNWRLQEERMLTHKGAVFDTLLLVALARTPGLTAANAWNDTEHTYGKSDGAGNLRLGAHVFHYLNEYFQGVQVEAQSNSPRGIVPFAVVRNDGGRSFALINRSGAMQTVTLSSELESGAAWYSATIDAEGLHHSGPVFPFAQTLKMPADSVYFFWQSM